MGGDTRVYSIAHLGLYPQHFGSRPGSGGVGGVRVALGRMNLVRMVVCAKIGEYRPQNSITLIIGAPKKVPLILGNLHISKRLAKLRLSPFRQKQLLPKEGLLDGGS